MQGKLLFRVTGLDVTVPEGIRLKWEGREIDSGAASITLGMPGSAGVIDYDARTVNVEFRVRIVFSELAEILDDMGAASDITAPVNAVIRSQGVVFDDHCFRLAGRAELSEHRLFNPTQTKVEILAPTRCKPDKVSRSGPEIYEALLVGESVSWNFNPTEKRVLVTLPQALGGDTQKVCLAGYYTFTRAAAPQALVP